METNPLAVLKAFKEIKLNREEFNPGRQHTAKEYQFESSTDLKNMAKYIKSESVDRATHGQKDLSTQISPFKNRIAIKDSYRSKLGYNTMQ